MCLKDKVYLSGRNSSSPNDCILVYTPATDTWDTLDTPVHNFALTTYRSKLVLVEGWNYVCEGVVRSTSNKLWTLSEDGKWEETLPPMETACGSDAETAVSHGDHLLVIDGEHKYVRVYNGHHWAKAQYLPEEMKRSSYITKSIKSVVFNGKLYVFAKDGSGKRDIYSTSVDPLIASFQPSETSQPLTKWKRLPYVPGDLQNLAVFGEKLIAVGSDASSFNAIYSYFPSGRSWEYVGASPISRCLIASVVLPSNELIVIGEEGPMFKGTLDGKQ